MMVPQVFKKSILLTNFNFIDILHLALQRKTRDYTIFWDPYRADLGFLVTVMVYAFGRKRSGVFLTKLGSMLRLKILPVPHGDAIVDYHALQIRSENELTQHITRDYENFGLSSNSFYCNLGIDEFCTRALDLKRSGLILGFLIENLKVLKYLGYLETEVVVSCGEAPLHLVEEIVSTNGGKLRQRFWTPDLISFVVSILLLIVKTSSFLVRNLFNCFARQIKSSNTSRIAVEFVDPNCCSGRPTEPNFLSTVGIESKQILAYVRSPQISRAGPRKNFKLPDGIPLVFLDQMTISASGLKTFTKVGFSLVVNVAMSRVSFRRFLIDLKDLVNWLEFSSFMSVYKPKVHVFNALPNGRTETRFDSGIYTGVCRKFNCLSVGYQSRLQYRQKLYYYFEVFDKFYFWGNAWKNAYAYPQFIVDPVSLGYLGVNLGTLESETLRPKSNQITVFLGDIDTEHPLHYTLDYTISFLNSVLETLLEVYKNSLDKPSILIKPKDPEHWKILSNLERFKLALKNENLNILANLDARHSIHESLQNVNKVISIGFTTPGLDALAMGIPSIYFTSYRGIYNEILDCPDSPIVARDKDTLVRFLTKEEPYDKDFLRSIIGEESSRSLAVLKRDLEKFTL